VMRRYRIFVIGGRGAVSDAVLAEAQKYAHVVVRIEGNDRYATAAAVSRTFNDPGTKTAYVVSGENYPDGLVAAPSAAQEYAPVLLTAAASLPASTRTELARLKPQRVVVVGGTGVVSAHVFDQLRGIVGSGGSVLRLAGASRYDTAVAVSRRLWAEGAGSVALASGANFPDALALGPVTRGYLPLLLTAPDHLPASTRAEVQRLRPSSVLIAGGTAVVGTAIEGELRAIPDLP
ncbi:MAG TPA: cell wall-binding repeat-containing protein, partial [Pedococcus sp.]|nr:cell wall-binding repeat-containing protein [Pedococcus sp.]